MKGYHNDMGEIILKEDKEKSPTKSQQAFQNLQKYRRKGTVDIDYKNEIADAIKKKYGDKRID